MYSVHLDAMKQLKIFQYYRMYYLIFESFTNIMRLVRTSSSSVSLTPKRMATFFNISCDSVGIQHPSSLELLTNVKFPKFKIAAKTEQMRTLFSAEIPNVSKLLSILSKSLILSEDSLTSSLCGKYCKKNTFVVFINLFQNLLRK